MRISNPLTNRQIALPVFGNIITQLALYTILALMLTISGCGSSEDAQQASDDSGEIVIGLTDAEGDFLSYSVDVTSLSLTMANGAVVETLPLETKVDFAQYTDMTEFLTAATVPSGRYVKANLTLNYDNAEIWVEDANGDGVQVNNIVDADGNPVSELDVSVRLEGRNSLLIRPGVPAHITLDFDLNASNKVEFDDNGVPTQTVDPFLLADLVLEKPKIHRLRGPLADVDIANNQFEVIIRPFHHTHANDRRFGSLDVHVSEQTVYDIDNVDYTGEAGLQALSEKTAYTATIVVGDLKFFPRRFVAKEVYAGESVPGGTLDVVRGTVISRQGNIINVKGATLIRDDGSVVFNDVVAVTVSDMTKVKRQLSMEQYSIADISVGQRVSVAGNLTEESATQLAMDASEGVVRMKITTLHATTVEEAANDPMIVDLQAINGRRVEIFDFSGTGIDTGNDANPENYEIATGNLDLAGIVANTPVVVGGFVRPYGEAPDDFDAQTVVDLSNIQAVLAVNWEPASSAPFLNTSSEAVTLNLEGVGQFHHVGRGRIAMDLNDFATDASVAAAQDGDGVFIIEQAGTRQFYTDFAAFVAEIDQRLTDGGTMRRFVASGKFNDSTVELNNARMIAVSMN